jgi:hypothetical protein
MACSIPHFDRGSSYLGKVAAVNCRENIFL